MLPLVWLEELSRPGTNHKSAFARLSAITCAILLGPAIYIVAVKQSLGFWLAPPLYQGIHHLLLTPSFVVTNLISYSGYIGLLLIPFSFLPLWKLVRSRSGIVKILGAGLLLFTLGLFVVVPNGEMNFGPLDAYLTPRIAGGCFALCAGLLPLCIADGIQSESANPSDRRYMICLAAGIFLFIGVLSFTRAGATLSAIRFAPGLLFCRPCHGGAQTDGHARDRCEHCVQCLHLRQSSG